MHLFNGHASNFYISTGQGSCSLGNGADADAEFFCKSFYGPLYKPTSYIEGAYSDSGQLGWQMLRQDPYCTGAGGAGDNIYGTNCNGKFCRILNSNELQPNLKGLYDIV